MLVEDIWLENVKCFAPTTQIDLATGELGPHKWVVVYGDNGLGKSTLLRALGMALTGQPALNTLLPNAEGWVRDSASAAIVGITFRKGSGDKSGGGPRARSINVCWRFGSARPLQDGPLVYPAHSIDLVDRYYSHVLDKRGHRVTAKQLDEDVKLFKEYIATDEPKRGWLICGYGPHRRLSGASSELVERIPPDGRAARLMTLFHERAALTSAELWLRKLHHRASIEPHGPAHRRLDAVVQMINTGLLHGGVTLTEITPEGVYFKTPFSPRIPIDDLSDGYRTILALTLDLLRHVEYCFDIESVLETRDGHAVITAEGVVLIDEIDAHLHPAWQKAIGPWLHSRFPNVQFIVATHSPLIATRVSETEGMVIRLVRRKKGKGEVVEAVTEEGTIGLTADQRLTGPDFGLPPPATNSPTRKPRRSRASASACGRIWPSRPSASGCGRWRRSTTGSRPRSRPTTASSTGRRTRRGSAGRTRRRRGKRAGGDDAGAGAAGAQGWGAGALHAGVPSARGAGDVEVVWKAFRASTCGKAWFDALVTAYGHRCLYCDHAPGRHDRSRDRQEPELPWRRRLAHDGALLSALSRIFVESVHAFYVERAAAGGARGAKTGAVTVVQRTSSDLRLNPHLHVVFLDGAYHEDGAALAWEELGHLKTREVGEVLERAVRRIARYLRRHGAIEPAEGEDEDVDPEEKLAASAVSGQAPPAGPQWLRGLSPLSPSALAYDKPLCASLDGFTLHAATKAGALNVVGREALLRYVLRPPLAQERLEAAPRWPRAHHTEAGLRRRDRGGRDGSALAAVQARDERAAAPLSHREVCGRARASEPMAITGRAAAKGPRRGGRGRRSQGPEACGHLPPLGGAPAADIRRGRPGVPHVPRAHEARRHGDGTKEHRPLPRRHRRARRGARPISQPRSALLEERRAATQGARRRRVASGTSGATQGPTGNLRRGFQNGAGACPSATSSAPAEHSERAAEMPSCPIAPPGHRAVRGLFHLRALVSLTRGAGGALRAAAASGGGGREPAG